MTQLPTDIAATYPDRDPGDTTHQGHHDTAHAWINDHSNNVTPDPHGDRAYADGRFSPLEHTHERLPLLAANSRTPTSAPGGFPEGRTVMVATSASGTWPGSGDGFLFSTINGTYPAMQEFLDLTTPPRLFVRRWAVGTSTWSVWGEK